MSRLTLGNPEAQARLAGFIAGAAGGPARILEALPLKGGAIQENWLVTAEIGGEVRDMVLRTDAPTGLAVSHGRAQEFAILRAAHTAGVCVPEPLWLCRDPAVLGRDFYLMRRIAGVAQGHRVVKDKSLGGDRTKLAERLGAELARIHAIRPGAPGLEFLSLPQGNPALAAIAGLRAHLDRWERGHPVLEWGLRRLELSARDVSDIVLIHQDFRTGNYMIDAAGLTGILDWEFAAWGDPMTDIGWFCARCWRFGAEELEAGGIAPRAPFYRGYEQASGRRIDAAAVHFWEAMAHIRWAVIALQQAHRHIAGGERSLELALDRSAGAGARALDHRPAGARPLACAGTAPGGCLRRAWRRDAAGRGAPGDAGGSAAAPAGGPALRSPHGRQCHGDCRARAGSSAADPAGPEAAGAGHPRGAA